MSDRTHKRPYALYYVSEDWPEQGTWMVRREQYADFDDHEPLDQDDDVFVSRWPSEAEAHAEAERLQAAQRRLVPVVSFVFYTGPKVGPDEEVSCGGFDWYYTLADAEKAYGRELHDNGSDPAACRVRLVCLSVPQHLDGQELTDYLDADIDRIEHTAKALREANVGGMYREDQEVAFMVAGQTFPRWDEAADYAAHLRESGTPAQVQEVAA